MPTKCAQSNAASIGTNGTIFIPARAKLQGRVRTWGRRFSPFCAVFRPEDFYPWDYVDRTYTARKLLTVRVQRTIVVHFYPCSSRAMGPSSDPVRSFSKMFRRRRKRAVGIGIDAGTNSKENKMILEPPGGPGPPGHKYFQKFQNSIFPPKHFYPSRAELRDYSVRKAADIHVRWHIFINSSPSATPQKRVL